MKYLRDYIQESLANGKYFFTKSEVLSILRSTPVQFKLQAYRLIKRNVIHPLTKDSFMIIPSEYRNLEGIPPHWIINSLMNHLNQEYYIGLLSAAAMYGAAHQQPMHFQVITDKQHRPIKLKRGQIEFHKFNHTNLSFKETVKSPAGQSNISSKEQTILDLVRFYQHCGYLSNVCLVIKDLIDNCTIDNLSKVIKQEKNTSVLQRLGFLLSYIGQNAFANLVKKELSKRRTQFILLSSELKDKKGERNLDFKIVINTIIELDE